MDRPEATEWVKRHGYVLMEASLNERGIYEEVWERMISNAATTAAKRIARKQ